MTQLTPREIVRELDRYIIGQDEAKRAVAVALRNRYRRAQLPEDIREEVTPKNILMIGPTGVGKTEIARRLAKAGGRAVRQGGGHQVHRGRLRRPRRRIHHPRPDRGVDPLVKEQHSQRVRGQAEVNVENRLVELLTHAPKKKPTNPSTSCWATGRRSRSSAPRIATSSPSGRTTCARACAAARWRTKWSRSRSKR